MANPNPKTDHLPKIQPGEVRNPKGSSRRQRAQNALFKLFGEEKLDEWINRALVAKGLDMDEVALKKPDGKPRDPELAALLALREWAYGKMPIDIDVTDGSDQEKKRIEVPDVDERPEGRKGRRPARKEGKGGDVPS